MRPRVVRVVDPDPARSAAARLAELTGVPRHRAVVVLGSGWAPAAEAFGEPLATLPMTDLPGFVAPVAEGHRGTVASYDVDGVPTLVLFGRTHLYEGLGLGPVVHGIRTAAAAGCTTAVLTNANGSLRADWEVGRVVLVRDHLNLTGDLAPGRPALRRPHRLLVAPAACRWPATWTRRSPRRSTPGCRGRTTRRTPRPSGYDAAARTCSGCRRSPRRSWRENAGSRWSGSRR